MDVIQPARRFLVLALLALIPLRAQDTVRSLTILHTNDLHAHLLPNENFQGGFAYLATALREERERCKACLYLNAGDLVQGTPVSTIYHGVPIYEIANLLGIDVATLGNHDFDYGWQTIERFEEMAPYPIVSANVVDRDGRFLAEHPYVIQTVNGIRVAVIGVLMGDLLGRYITAELLGPWHVIPVVDAVRRTVAQLRDRSDLIIVLGHIQDAETNQIMEHIPEVSVIVAGHDHKGYPELKRVGDRVAVQLKGYGVELGRLDLRVDVARKKIESADWKRIPIDARTIPPAKDVAKLIDEWEGKVSAIVDVPIGEARRRIAGDDLRLLIEKAMASEAATDFGFINRGNVRAALPQGQLLARDVWNVLPFDNEVVVGKFKGSQLPPVVKAGRQIDPDREYTLATTDFTAANQASFDQLGMSGLQFSGTGRLQRDMFIEWIKRKKMID